jgi:hypothetical protein
LLNRAALIAGLLVHRFDLNGAAPWIEKGFATESKVSLIRAEPYCYFYAPGKSARSA